MRVDSPNTENGKPVVFVVGNFGKATQMLPGCIQTPASPLPPLIKNNKSGGGGVSPGIAPGAFIVLSVPLYGSVFYNSCVNVDIRPSKEEAKNILHFIPT